MRNVSVPGRPPVALSRLGIALVAVAVTLCCSAGARADESGKFVVSLGRDTTTVDHYKRSDKVFEVDQVGRVPRVVRRKITYTFTKGAFTGFSMVTTPVGATVPSQTMDAKVDGDSVRMSVQNADAPVRRHVMGFTPGAVVVTNASPWVVYESQIIKLVKSKRESVRLPLWFVGAASMNTLELRRIARDSIAIEIDRGDQFHAHVDGAGHMLALRPIAGPAQFTVARDPKADLDALAAGWAAREQAGTGLGVLSPRDTVQVADAGGATVTIDYSRPAKRGRVVYGSVVPYGQVWRTGANAATSFKTDKPLAFGSSVVPAGQYTLFTLPTAAGWKLMFNSQTGQWGTEHKPELDIATIDMRMAQLPEVAERFTIHVEPSAKGGVLHFDWDTTRASAPFTVQP